jgi:hypothetical protein
MDRAGEGIGRVVTGTVATGQGAMHVETRRKEYATNEQRRAEKHIRGHH